MSPGAGAPPPPPSQQLWYNVTVSATSGLQGAPSRTAKLTGLEPATIYAVRVLAANEVGVGPASEPVTAQTLQEGEQCLGIQQQSFQAPTRRDPSDLGV